MSRLVFSVDTVATARNAIARLRAAGIHDGALGLVAPSSTAIERLPDDAPVETTDFAPAMARGAALGGTTGLVAGLVAASIPAMGVALGGVALISAVAAAVGAWSGALAGSAVPHTLQEDFEDEIARGRILVGVDSHTPATAAQVRAIVRDLRGARLLQDEAQPSTGAA